MKQIRPYLAAFFLLIGANAHGQSIATGNIIGSPFCAGTNVNVPYTISGTFNSGNVFRAQLSDASGVFGSSPTVIGSLTSRTNGTITATIPSSTPAGTNYRVRVVSTNPIRTGTESSSILTIKSSGTCNVAGALIDDLLDVAITSPSTGQILSYNGSNWVNSSASSAAGGTVTNVSVVSANGLAGTVANPTTTPALTLSTTVTGLLKGNGTALSAAVSGTDYAAAAHTHAITDVNLLNDSLRKKSDTSHTHTISKITGLQNALDGKWNLTGNNGLNASTNFIGTTDKASLIFKVNNTKSGLIDYASSVINSSGANTSLGYSSFVSNSTGYNNTANGAFSLASNTTGTVNTAIGKASLYSNTNGSENVAVGVNALYANTGGYANVAVGLLSSSNNTNGSYNTAVGTNSLEANTSGRDNTAVGFFALKNNTASYNVAVGSNAMFSNTTGDGNVAVGALSLYFNTTGYTNTSLGNSSLYNNTTGSENTAVGHESLTKNTTGSSNTAIGKSSMKENTTGGYNTAVGVNSLLLNTTGGGNTAIGLDALKGNTTGKENSALGLYSMRLNTTGDGNSSFGFQSLYNNTLGYWNSSFGHDALSSNTEGFDNVGIGKNAMLLNATGYQNTGVGHGALAENTTGSLNTALGSDADVITGNLTNATAIGANAIVNNSNQVQLGSSGTTVSGGTYLTTSDGRFKKNLKEDAPGLDFIMKLKPVTYNLQYTKYSDFLKEKNADKAQLQQRESKREMGLVAQEVEKACKDLGIEVSNLVHVPENDKDNYSLAYGNLVVPLIRAMQEQQILIEELKKRNDEQDKKIAALEPNGNTASSVTVNTTGATATLENTLTAPLLGQNIPNPFTKTTVIPFRIPGNCTDATIVISNLATGQVVKAITVSCKETQLSIDASQLASGSYSYSLYIDGKSVVTKKMTLSK